MRAVLGGSDPAGDGYKAWQAIGMPRGDVHGTGDGARRLQLGGLAQVDEHGFAGVELGGRGSGIDVLDVVLAAAIMSATCCWVVVVVVMAVIVRRRGTVASAVHSIRAAWVE